MILDITDAEIDTVIDIMRREYPPSRIPEWAKMEDEKDNEGNRIQSSLS